MTVNQVAITMSGLKADGSEVAVSLMHLGSALLRDANRHLQPFSHAPRACSLTLPLVIGATPTVAVENNLRGEPGFFAEVSPFASWRLEVPADLNPGVVLSAIDRITLTFAGSFAPLGN